jgi:hypothetical protein
MLRFSLLLTCSLLTSTLIGQHTVFAMEPEGTLHQEPSSPKKIISFDSEKMTRACEAARLALGDAFLDNFEARNKPGAGHRQETNYYRIRTQAVTAFFEKTLH